MKHMVLAAAAIGWAISTDSIAAAQEFYVYPSKGQSQQQMNKDRGECHVWAVQQTGFDPTNLHVAAGTPPQAEAPESGLLRG